MARVRKFQIEVVKDRVVTETVYKRVKREDGGSALEASEVKRKIAESFMVYFPGKHSVWFESREKMAMAGILEHANVEIDTETGDAISEAPVANLKALVDRNTQELPAQRGM